MHSVQVLKNKFETGMANSPPLLKKLSKYKIIFSIFLIKYLPEILKNIVLSLYSKSSRTFNIIFVSENPLPFSSIKISGRYLIKNIENIILYLESFFNKGGEFAIPVSNLFFKTNSVMYAFSSSFKKQRFEEICKKISDNDGLYVEHLLYSEVFLNTFINSLRMTKVLPKYPIDQEGGSCQGSYTFWRQLIKNFIYKYF